MPAGVLNGHALRLAEDIKLAAKLAFKMAEQRQRQRQNIALRAG